MSWKRYIKMWKAVINSRLPSEWIKHNLTSAVCKISQYHRVVKVGSGPTSLLKQSYWKQVTQDHVQMAFQYFQDEYSTAISRQLLQYSVTIKKLFSDSHTALSLFPFSHCFLSCHWTPKKAAWLNLCIFSSAVCVCWWVFPWAFFPDWTVLPLPALPPKEKLQNNWLIEWLGLEGTLKIF